jgi:4-hydroxyphenylpyruvate dioxygenase
MKNEFLNLEKIEYVDYCVRNLDETSKMFEKLGFECIGIRSTDLKKSKLYVQGDMQIILSASQNEKSDVYQFTRTHGDGIKTLAFAVAEPAQAVPIAKRLGASIQLDLTIEKADAGKNYSFTEIGTYGDILHRFIKMEKGSQLSDFFSENKKNLTPQERIKGKILQTIDHLTINVEKGKVDYWAKFHEEMYGFNLVRIFDIQTDRTGLFSRAMRSPNGRVTMPFNEPTNSKSQIQEFLDTFKGPGVQHLAFHTADIIHCLRNISKEGFRFLTVPETYYEMVASRVPNVKENMKDLMQLGILVDGSDKGYLLQIFTETLMGPFFFEFIQRKGDNGFGDGNFRALFEAIERDQIRRGVL